MKIALVTGAAKGLGLAWSEVLASKGYTVIVTARKLEAAKSVETELNNSGKKSIAMSLDVSSEDSIKEAANQVDQKFGYVDLIINNAGTNPKDFKDPQKKAKAFQLDHLDFEVMNQVYAVNSLGPLMVVKHFRALLKKSQSPKVINISSWLGSITLLSFGGHYGYVSSKNLLNVLNKSMALEIINDGIISVNVNPGWVKTNMGGSRAQFTPQESVHNMYTNVIDKISINDTGKFFNYDGKEHPW